MEKRNRIAKAGLFITYLISPIFIGIALILLGAGRSVNAKMLGNAVYYIGITILAGIVFKRELANEFSAFRNTSFNTIIKNILFGFGLYLSALEVASICITMLSQLLDAQLIETNDNQLAINEMLNNSLLISIPITCIMGPFVEEIIYRKMIFSFIAKHNAIVAIFVSSALFALLHEYSSFLKYSVSQVLIDSIPYFLMGVVFCIVYKRTNNILYSIIVHSMVNISALTIFFGTRQ